MPPDPLAKVNEPRWLVTREKQRIVESIKLPPRWDLFLELTRSMERFRDQGWTIEPGTDWGGYFVTRADIRWDVAIEAADPNAPNSSAAINAMEKKGGR